MKGLMMTGTTKKLAAGIALSLTLLGATPCRADELWNGLNAAMSTAEVVARVPSAKPQVPLGGLHEVWSMLSAEPVQIGSRTFDVSFHFKEARLDSVGLSMREEDLVRSGAPFRYAAELLTGLRQKYGQELNAQDHKLVFPDHYESKWSWVKGDTSIVLTAYEMPGLGQLGIIYARGAKASVDKL